ncbi:MAG: fluoride efflux transporter CrcB [Methanosarcinaceae archaeon]|nr:fluoride efflux transporter CrcB [Methanosarcinaceae archaeon]MDF1533079.1 fluoride efflux transporter CrcB [Methanosarcinaceae archaeon]
MRTDLSNLLIIGIGGFFGAISRFLLSSAVATPFNTLIVNVLGSFALGMLMYKSGFLGYVSQRTRMGFGIGFLGSFTTFSTFAIQSYQMAPTFAIINIAANVILTLIAVLMGRGVIIILSKRKESGVAK